MVIFPLKIVFVSIKNGDLMRSFLTNLGIFRRFRRDDHDGLILRRRNSDSR